MQRLFWAGMAVLAALAFGVIAIERGEPVNSIWLVLRVRVYVSDRLPLLREVHRGEGDDARRPPRHTGGAAAQRARLRADEQVDRVRPSFRRDRRTGTAGRADARGAVRLSSGNAVDHHRRRARRRGSGLRHSVLLHPARRQVAGADGARGDRKARRHHGADHRAADHDHSAGGDRAGGGECAERQPVGHVHDRRDDADRGLHGAVSALLAAGQGAGSFGDRVRAGGAEHLRRAVGVAQPDARSDVHVVRNDAGDLRDRLRLLRERASGVAAARAARLSEHVRETRRGADAGRRHSVRAAGSATAGVHAFRRRDGADLRGQDLSVLLHHDRLRRDLGLSRADLVGNDAEDDRARVARVAGGLWVDGAGELRRDHGADRGVCAAARRVLRGELAGGRRRSDAGCGSRNDQRPGVIRCHGREMQALADDVGEKTCSIAPVGRRRSRWAWRTSSHRAAEGERFSASGITSPSCSRRCSS